MSTQQPLSVVLGAGLMGRLLAHGLARLGHRVEVHEAQGPDAQGAAARVAAAMLAPLAESAITEAPVVRMGQHALTRWQEILQSLTTPVFFQQNGTLILWHRQDAGEAQRFEQLLQRTQREHVTLPALQALQGQALQAIEPALEARFQQGLYLPGEGQLDNRQLLQALLTDLTAHALVQMHWNSARKPQDFAMNGAHAAQWVFDCRGLGARSEQPALRGVRGEVIRLHAPGVSLQRPTRLIHPRYPIYIAPKPDHVFVIGATEIETEDLSPASVRSTLELLSAAYTVHPGFGEARILEVATQARPTLPDNLPLLTVHNPRHISLNGLYRHGFLIAPALLDATLEWVQHGTLTLAQQFQLSVQHGG
jgi:glycine oxidase